MLVLALAVACRQDPPSGTPAAAGATAGATAEAPATQPRPEATATAVPSTPTPQEPLAASVNGQPIYLAEFEESLARLEANLPPDATDVNHGALVLDMLIERSLIQQAAATNGITVTVEAINQQMTELRQLAEENGGEGSFEAWLQANQWTEEGFREALAVEMLTERVSAFVTADVPEVVPHVRARYLQVDDLALAQSLLEQARNGANFAELAETHSLDRTTGDEGGDLGYFPQGTLLVPELEEAAFALQPGETSDVITATDRNTGQGTYYLVQVVDIDTERQLSPDLRANLLQERFEAWLAEQWAQAEIVRYVDTGA
jgi:parvulin-like peptidyl-prolyl isomerase